MQAFLDRITVKDVYLFDELGSIEAPWILELNDLGPFLVDIDTTGRNHFDKLDKVIEAKPEAVVVGQGAHGRMRITAEARERLEGANIEVIAAPTEEACETYSEIRESRYAAAALHLTC